MVYSYAGWLILFYIKKKKKVASYKLYCSLHFYINKEFVWLRIYFDYNVRNDFFSSNGYYIHAYKPYG